MNIVMMSDRPAGVGYLLLNEPGKRSPSQHECPH